MLKLMIADDERIIRETISSLIDWESLGVNLIGLCKDGVEAYDMILDETPDIVMTDIRMPGLTGLELIREITQTDLSIQFIVLSGYDEFEYAREAMKYGVKHYLLKPCDEKQIIDSILQVREECIRINNQKREKEQRLSMLQSIWQDVIYHLIADGIIAEKQHEVMETKLTHYSAVYGQDADFFQRTSYLCYFYFLETELLNEFLGELRNIAEGEEIAGLFYGLYVRNTLLFFYQDEVWNDRIQKICQAKWKKLQLEIQEYSDLLRLLETVIGKIKRYDTIYAIHNFCTIPILNSQNILLKVREIFVQLDHADENKIKKLCSELDELIEDATQLDFLKTLAINISIQFSNIDVFSMAEVAEFIQVINQQQEKEVIREGIEQLIQKSETQLCQSSRGYGILAEQIMKYVDEHLADQNLTLKQIAEQHLYMNVDYVSKQFQKATGIKFSRYLTERRVNKAKELLMHKETKKIQYVAAQVGYGTNSQYFSQIFKKVVGMTPSKWTEQIQGLDLEE